VPPQVWCLAVSSHGDFVVTGSHDRSIRRWERTEEPFFVEEEREKRLESMFEAGIENTAEERGGAQDGSEEGAVGTAGRRTQETMSAADSIIEALEMAELETQRILDHRVRPLLASEFFSRALSKRDDGSFGQVEVANRRR
jgi:U3 small nucleolar RNA-associated protein 12